MRQILTCCICQKEHVSILSGTKMKNRQWLKGIQGWQFAKGGKLVCSQECMEIKDAAVETTSISKIGADRAKADWNPKAP